MSLLPLKSLCIYNSLGTSYLSTSLDYRIPESSFENPNCDFNAQIRCIDRNSRVLPDDLRLEVQQISEQFQRCMQSEFGLLQILRENPQMALFIIKKYPQIDIHSVTVTGWTSLHFAAESGNKDLVQYLIEICHLDVKAVTTFGNTVLDLAVCRGNLELVRYLIEVCHLDVHASDKNGNTLLHCAAKSGNKDLLQYLIATHHLDVHSVNNSGDTILHSAAYHGDKEIIQYLIESHNLDVHAVSQIGVTVLHAATCFMEVNLELIKYLIETHHLDVHATTLLEKMTVLDFAARYRNNEALVEYLNQFR